MGEENPRKLSDMEDLNEDIITDKPWALHLLETSQKMTKKAVLNWCSIIMKIGETELNVDDFADIFLQEMSNLYEDLITDIDALQEKTLDKITKLHDQLKNLCQNLHAEIPAFNSEEISLKKLEGLINLQVKEYESLVEVRKRELSKLNQKQLMLCIKLGREPPMLLSESPLLPSPSEMDLLKMKIEALVTEITEREEQFFQLKEQITDIVDDLQYIPSSDFEEEILNIPDRETRITDKDMEQLQLFSNRLMEKLKAVRDEIGELKARIERFWNILGTDFSQREEFQQKNVGNSLKMLNDLKKEIKKLEDERKAGLKGFISKQREELTELWKKCHCSEEEKKSFRFFHDECFTEELFEIHDMEISKWREYYEENEEIFGLLHEHQKLQNELKTLDSNSEGVDRLKNRGGRLLVEEKNRKKLKIKIPKIEDKLLKMAETFFARQGRHFLTFGQTICDYIAKANEDRTKELKLKLSTKNQQREQQALTPGSCSQKLFLKPGTGPCRSPISTSASKRSVSPLLAGPSKKLKSSFEKKNSKKDGPTVKISKMRRLSKKVEQQRRKTLSFKSSTRSITKENLDQSGSTSYDDFEIEVSTKYGCRSTGYVRYEKPPHIMVTSPDGIPHHLQSSQQIPLKKLKCPFEKKSSKSNRTNVKISQIPRLSKKNEATPLSFNSKDRSTKEDFDESSSTSYDDFE